MKKLLSFCILLCLSSLAMHSQSGRWEKDLSGDGWQMWLDRSAQWYDDEIHLPPVNVATLPVNLPTCGWAGLHKMEGLEVQVPGTVEEYYWGEIGGAIPDTGGNYVGVSWWSTTFQLDPSLEGRRITLCFASVNLRAEVFVNGRLTGYDVIGNTPFDVDITRAVKFSEENRLDIRITDPVGNFSWNDNILMRWGKHLIPAVHGFGGITGPVLLRATHQVAVEDVYVQNQSDPKKVKVFVTLNNHSTKTRRGTVSLDIHPLETPSSIVWRGEQKASVGPGKNTYNFTVHVPDAKLWELSGYQELKKAALYGALASFEEGKKVDSQCQRFGFRWFDIGEKDGDQRFYLNGERVFIMAAMTRGFWPKNGIFPTPEMARRDMEELVGMGMNMMLLHRAIGQPEVIEYADTAGLFTYEEPGGYRVAPNQDDRIEGPDAQALALRREKLRRMVIRDRSFPSMLIYNLKNEARNPPDEDDIRNVRMVHELDPSRIITYNSDRNRQAEYYEIVENDPYKLHMRPFDDELWYSGWWDHHHWYAYPGYVDVNYNNPMFYLRGVVNGPREPQAVDSLYRLDKSEVIFFGEEGAFGTMVRLEKISRDLEGTGATGFREQEHIDWFKHYDRFLDETGYRTAYPSVDALTLSMGRNLHYFQGRNIENVRMGNIADAYNMNGWGSASTRTDVVDMYRNPTADPSIIARYTRPLYVAVKLREKVVPAGASPVADFFIVNQENVRGEHTLLVTVTGPGGEEILRRKEQVSITGGETFGELILEGVQLPELETGAYYRVHALLEKEEREVTSGEDEVFVVEYMIPGENSQELAAPIAVLESDGVIAKFLKDVRGITAIPYGEIQDDLAVIIIGKHDPAKLGNALKEKILEQVGSGAKLIVLEQADHFAQQIQSKLRVRPAFYKGGGIVDRRTQGRQFVGHSPYLEGLPQAQGMSWEYQYFYSTRVDGGNGQVSGLRLDTRQSDWVVSVGAQGTKEILCALNRISFGKGQVFLSTLNILPGLSSDQSNAVVAKKLFLNLLEKP